MRTQLTKGMTLAATALGVVLTTPAFAQDGSAGGTDSAAIIVTARRVEERLQDVPISITVYNQEAIDKRNIVNAADLATYTPSLSVNSNYGPEKASFAIRGFVQDFQTAPSVGVYFADVVGPRGSSTTTAGNGVGIGNLFDLQNVQVLKGPQGTLFGRNTTGGAVLLVPNKPTDRLEGYVEGSLGNYDMKRVQAVLNVPLADTFKVRLGVDRMKRDGYITNHSGIGPDHLANTDYIALRLSILAELTPDLENYTIATYSDSDNYGTIQRIVGCKSDGSDGPFVSLQFYAPLFACPQLARQQARGDGWWDAEQAEPDPRQHTETWQVINTTTWQASDSLTIKNIVSYAEHREDTSINLTGGNWLNPDGSQFVRSLILITNTPGYHYGAESTFTEELQFQGQTGKLKWQAGGYLEVSDPIGYGSQTVPFMLTCPDPGALECNAGISFGPGIRLSNLGQPFYKYWWRSKGLYAQGTYELNDQLSVTGGFRYTWDEMRHYQSSITMWFDETNVPIAFCSNSTRIPGPAGPGDIKFITPGDFHQCDLEFQTKSSKPTWVIDLEYKPIPDVMLFAKWSRGYRAGGVNTPFVFYETWDPEKVDTYEIGAKTSFRGAVPGYFNITGFYNDFRNQQLQVNLNNRPGAPASSGTGTVNAGKSRIWGVEVDAAATLFNSLKFDVGYTYLNTKLISIAELQPTDYSPWVPGETPWAEAIPSAGEGERLALSPKHRLQVGATYTLPIDESIGEISFGATYVHTSSQISNRVAVNPYGLLPASDLLNLNASWHGMLGQPIDLSFFMTNATKEKFPIASVNTWPIFGYAVHIPNEPRMWGFRLKYHFGE